MVLPQRLNINLSGMKYQKQLDRPLVNSPNKIWRDLTQTKNLNTPLQIGVSLRYTNEVHNEMADLVDKNTNDPKSKK